MELTKNQQKKKAALISIFSNTSLIILKIIAGILTGSIGIISEAIHSSTDLLASFIAFFSVSESAKPADGEHQYGHGKYEDFAGLTEGVLIIIAAFYIVYEAIKKITHHLDSEIDVNLGLVVMLVSIVANFFVSRYLLKIARNTDSMALFADAEHLRTDIFSSVAVFIGFIAIKLTGNVIYDPIIAIMVAVIIFLAGFKIVNQAKKNLLDTSLSKSDISQIELIISNCADEHNIKLKNLRTRKSGFHKKIDIILFIDGSLSICQGHSICDRIEEQIELALENTDTTIHLEPRHQDGCEHPF